MAQYKVPQDVEADDKLLGPFAPRQVLYLFVIFALGFVCYLLFQVFPLLIAIPIPFMIFLAILAFPFKKDQPMETYVTALINFYTKPNKRFWNPGQRESTITITAPKVVEGPRIRAISEDEASHRLSFLADIVDSNGQSVRENWNTSMQDEYIAEAASTPDIYENYNAETLTSRVADQSVNKHDEAIEKMRAAIAEIEGKTSPSSNPTAPSAPTITHGFPQETPHSTPSIPQPPMPPSSSTIIQPQTSSPIIQPNQPIAPPSPAGPQIGLQTTIPTQQVIPQPQIPTQPSFTPQLPNQPPSPANPARTVAFEQLANNNSYSVATIAKEASRITNEDNKNGGGETFVSLH